MLLTPFMAAVRFTDETSEVTSPVADLSWVVFALRTHQSSARVSVTPRYHGTNQSCQGTYETFPRR